MSGYVLLERDINGIGMCGMYSNAVTPKLAFISAQCNVTSPPEFCKMALASSGNTSPPTASNDSLPAWAIVLISFAAFFGALILIYVIRWCCNFYLPTSKYNIFASRDEYTPLASEPTHEE